MDFFENLSRQDCIKEAEKRFVRLLSQAERGNTGQYRFSYSLTGIGTESGKADFPCDFSFEKGLAGIIVFSAAVSRFAVSDDVKKSAKALTAQLLSDMEAATFFLEKQQASGKAIPPVSFADGLGGLLFALLKTGEIIREADDEIKSLISRLVNLIISSDPARSPLPADYFCGLAGTLKLMLNNDSLFSLAGVEDYCRRLCDILLKAKTFRKDNFLLWDTIGAGVSLSGMAHGQCGIASALYSASEHLDLKDCRLAAMEAYQYEKAIFDPVHKAWPDLRPGKGSGYMCGICSGAPGIGFDMLDKYHENELFAEILDLAVDSCLKTGILSRDHLCCGNCAVIEFLIEAGQNLGRKDLKAAAGERLLEIRRRAEKSGDYTFIDSFTAPTLYYGHPGIGYEFLRYAFPAELPSCVL